MNVTEALDAAVIEWREGSNADEIWICCPFCAENGESVDERFRLGINVLTGWAHCFNCEWGSKTSEFTFSRLQKILDTGEMEVQQEHRKKKKKSHGEKVLLPEGFELLERPNSHTDHWNNKAWKFMRTKYPGIKESQILDAKIGFSVLGDFHHRVIVPVYQHKKLVGLVGRDFTGKQELKYRNSVGDKTIYNLPSHRNKSICLSESVFDALAIWRGSKRLMIDSGALLGHSLKDEQLELLEPYKNIYLWLDPDPAGVKGSCKIVKQLPKDKNVRIVLPWSFKHPDEEDFDPSELDYNDITKRLDRAKLFTEEVQLKLKAWVAFDDE